MCISVSPASMCGPLVCLVLWRPEEGIGSPGAGVIAGCKLSLWMLGNRLVPWRGLQSLNCWAIFPTLLFLFSWPPHKQTDFPLVFLSFFRVLKWCHGVQPFNLLCSQGWPWTSNPPAQVLRLQACFYVFIMSLVANTTEQVLKRGWGTAPEHSSNVGDTGFHPHTANKYLLTVYRMKDDWVGAARTWLEGCLGCHLLHLESGASGNGDKSCRRILYWVRPHLMSLLKPD